MTGTANSKNNRRIGEFLVTQKIITQTQLDDALDMQRFNKERLLGEILVTQGVLTKEQLVMALEMFLMETDVFPEHVDEWLDQDEVDMILDRLKKG